MADQQIDTDSEAQEYDHPIVSSRGREYTDEHRADRKPDHVTMIRQYSVPNENLWAYRVDDDPDEHIVVIDDGERYHKHVKRVPAERTAAVPGEKLWTIPENWEAGMSISRDMIDYGRYRIPETDIWVEVSIPTNDHVGDAWYQVRKVGKLTAEPPTAVGKRHEARSLLDERFEKVEEEWNLDSDQLDVERAVYDAITENWEDIEEEHRMGCQAVLDDPPWFDRTDSLYRLADGWEYEDQWYVFRVEKIVKQVAEIDDEWADDHDTALSEAVNALREADLLPYPYKVEIGIDESGVDEELYLTGLCEAGCSAAEALDYYQVEIVGRTQEEWADKRGVGQSTVSENVSEAEGELGK